MRIASQWHEELISEDFDVSDDIYSENERGVVLGYIIWNEKPDRCPVQLASQAVSEAEEHRPDKPTKQSGQEEPEISRSLMFLGAPENAQ